MKWPKDFGVGINSCIWLPFSKSGGPEFVRSKGIGSFGEPSCCICRLGKQTVNERIICCAVHTMPSCISVVPFLQLKEYASFDGDCFVFLSITFFVACWMSIGRSSNCPMLSGDLSLVHSYMK